MWNKDTAKEHKHYASKQLVQAFRKVTKRKQRLHLSVRDDRNTSQLQKITSVLFTLIRMAHGKD